jgi:SAM-dependent methyltransferase
MSGKLSWEQAVMWLKEQPGQASLVRACYFDDPLVDAACRFTMNEEWQAVKAFLPSISGLALDLGAGRGISSYALAHEGWEVVALEPDPSGLVGAGAIQSLALESRLPISVCEAFGEALPFRDSVFDVVYSREVIHHARSVNAFCLEVARVLKPGGRFIATREHVISKPGDLQTFLDNHPLHKYYGGENAFLLSDYIHAISGGGLKIRNVLSPLDSPINENPIEVTELQNRSELLFRKVRHHLITKLPSMVSTRISRAMNKPGRLYSFVAYKPEAEVS